MALSTSEDSTGSGSIFPDLNAEDSDDLGPTQIESLCMNCFQNVSQGGG